MKFGKSLSNQIEETLPEWRDKFLSYKELKKRLKLIEPKKGGDRPNKRQRLEVADGGDAGGGNKEGMTEEEYNGIIAKARHNIYFLGSERVYHSNIIKGMDDPMDDLGSKD